MNREGRRQKADSRQLIADPTELFSWILLTATKKTSTKSRSDSTVTHGAVQSDVIAGMPPA